MHRSECSGRASGSGESLQSGRRHSQQVSSVVINNKILSINIHVYMYM